MAGVTWYAFDFKDYASDTARLTCEGHGAYIQLITDYYNTKQPIPDDDFILAAVTKLPIETWKQHRKVLERYFTITDGFWRHERIDAEIKDACEKHAASIAAAKVGAGARWAKERAKKGQEPEGRQSSTVKTPKNADRNATAQRVAQEPQSARPADLDLHPLITGGGKRPPPRKRISSWK